MSCTSAHACAKEIAREETTARTGPAIDSGARPSAIRAAHSPGGPPSVATAVS